MKLNTVLTEANSKKLPMTYMGGELGPPGLTKTQ